MRLLSGVRKRLYNIYGFSRNGANDNSCTIIVIIVEIVGNRGPSGDVYNVYSWKFRI